MKRNKLKLDYLLFLVSLSKCSRLLQKNVYYPSENFDSNFNVNSPFFYLIVLIKKLKVKCYIL